MDEDTFNEFTAGTKQYRDATARQVNNGFVLSGSIRFVIEATQTVKIHKTFEAVAANETEAATAVSNFLTTGSF